MFGRMSYSWDLCLSLTFDPQSLMIFEERNLFPVENFGRRLAGECVQEFAHESPVSATGSEQKIKLFWEVVVCLVG